MVHVEPQIMAKMNLIAVSVRPKRSEDVFFCIVIEVEALIDYSFVT